MDRTCRGRNVPSSPPIERPLADLQWNDFSGGRDLAYWCGCEPAAPGREVATVQADADASRWHAKHRTSVESRRYSRGRSARPAVCPQCGQLAAPRGLREVRTCMSERLSGLPCRCPSIATWTRAFSMRISIDRSANRCNRASSFSRLALNEPSESKGRSSMAGDYMELPRRMQAKLHAISKIARFYTEVGFRTAFRNACHSGRRSSATETPQSHVLSLVRRFHITSRGSARSRSSMRNANGDRTVSPGGH